MSADQNRTGSSAFDCDVVIVGAGPVGLLLANFLGQSGLGVTVLEKRTQPIAHSAAIGITPPSLHILARLGLDGVFVNRGVKVRDCMVHGERGRLGSVSFRGIADKFRWVLSLPQSSTINLLLENLAQFPTVKVLGGAEVLAVSQEEDGAVVEFQDTNSRRIETLKARWIVACDGARSRVREALGIRAPGKSYDCHFVMGDFTERTALGDEAHLFFKADGSVESFPLPGGLRRWIVQVPEPMRAAPPGFIGDVVRRRTGILLDPADQTNESAFTPRRFNCERYHDGHVVLCGDAAHGMSPIGGQGMNTGFADAELLAEVLPAIIQGHAAAGPLLGAYQRFRRKAAQTAIFRAEWGMWLGTWRGQWRSRLRDVIIGDVMCRWPIAPHMGPLYAMLTIPYNTLKRVPLSMSTLQQA